MSALGGQAEIMGLLDPEAPRRRRSRDVGLDVRLQPGIARRRDRRDRAAHPGKAREPASDRRPRASGDRPGSAAGTASRCTLPGSATDRMHWARSACATLRTKLGNDREKIVNLHLALMNDGVYQMSLGYF
jgi:hypothetical protein